MGTNDSQKNVMSTDYLIFRNKTFKKEITQSEEENFNQTEIVTGE